MEVTEVAEKYLGNIEHNADLAHRVATNSCWELSLPVSDRYKGRIYDYTVCGVAVGIIKNRERVLRSGDIYQTNSGKLLVIKIQPEEVLVLDFSALDPQVLPATLVYLGHLLGNHHYPIKIDREQIFIQLVTDKSVIEKSIKNLNIPGLKIDSQKISAELDHIFSQHSH